MAQLQGGKEEAPKCKGTSEIRAIECEILNSDKQKRNAFVCFRDGESPGARAFRAGSPTASVPP
jgi:hypothetical protein